MPYTSGSRLPGEGASKLGHLAVIQSDWVRSLIDAFEASAQTDPSHGKTPWIQFDTASALPLRSVWAADGSFVTVASTDMPPREVTFVKTALLAVDRARLEALDKDHPHPLLLQDVLTGSAVFHATALPLKNVRTALGSNYDAVRHIIRDSLRHEERGAFFETLKWLSYKGWEATPVPSPAFACPHCLQDHPGLPVGADDSRCPHCNGEVFLTDMLGFHLDMDEESAPEAVGSSYMLLTELLMLFTPIRLLWYHTDQQLVSNTLFIKDGPLSLRGQYSKLVPRLRDFLQFALDAKRPVHIVGQEKTGTFVDHLQSVVRFAPPFARGEQPAMAVLTHEYVRREVYRTPDLANPYGMRTNWGEKLLLKIDPGTFMVLNVPTGAYDSRPGFPEPKDLIGLDRILATIPSLISHKFEGALFPIELANGIASMSSYPSSAILQRFLDSP